jgi:hypothetical protein
MITIMGSAVITINIKKWKGTGHKEDECRTKKREKGKEAKAVEDE